MRKIINLIVFTLLVTFQLSPLTANATILNSHCSEAQWFAGSKVKIGKITAQCVAGPDTYYWIDIKQVSSDAAKAGPLARVQQSAIQPKSSLQVVVVPNLLGLPASSAYSLIQRSGLSGSRLYRSQGGQAGAECAMTNGGSVIGQAPNAGTVVRLHSVVQFATSC
jgi:hypothetical protein